MWWEVGQGDPARALCPSALLTRVQPQVLGLGVARWVHPVGWEEFMADTSVLGKGWHQRGWCGCRGLSVPC